MLRASHIVCLLLAFSLCLSNAAAVGSTPPEGGMKAAREILDRRFDARISLTYNCSISTTNGTGAICKSESASNVLIGSMLNCTAVAKRAVELGNDVILMCAGTGGEFSADDIYAAGAIASAIQTLTDAELCDLTRVSCLVYDRWKEDRTELSKTKHYKRLVSLGLESDINFCLTRDLTDIVPEYKNGVIEL